MIVRILGEGQFNVPDDELAGLNDLDNQLVDAIDSGDRDTFKETLDALLSGVRDAGERLPDDALESSDFVLPPGDASLEEVKDLLSDEGLVPG